MKTRSYHLPKVNPPNVHNFVARNEIFARLDKAVTTPLIWVAGPPGAGKTVTAANYLTQRKVEFAWLSLDNADRDPATFFHYLGLAIAVAHPSHRLTFPTFAPAFQTDPGAYARLFFRYLASRSELVPRIVFDNAQELSDSFFVQCLAVAVDEMQDVGQCIVLSRELPPPALARLQVNQKLLTIEPDQLAFTADEVQRFLALTDDNCGNTEKIYALTRGWAAGLVLLRDSGRECELKMDDALDRTGSKLFDYFTVEAFSQLDTTFQHFLLRTAYLPYISVATVRDITGDDQAEERLNRLCQRNLFVQRIQSRPPVYASHPLFREFLKVRAKRDLSASAFNALLVASAEYLHESGQFDDAVALYLESESWDPIIGILLENAPSLSQQGRHRILYEWLMRLPAALRQANPSLSLWLGEAASALSLSEAITYLEDAYHRFVEQGNLVGQLGAAVAALETIHWLKADYRDARKWAQLVTQICSRSIPGTDQTQEFRATCASLLADCILGVSQDNPARAQRIYERLSAEEIDVNHRLYAAALLLEYAFLTRFSTVSVLHWASTLISDGESSPSSLLWMMTLYEHGTAGNLEPHVELPRGVSRTVDEETTSALIFRADIVAAHRSIAARDFQSAEQVLEQAPRTLSTGGALGRVNFYVARGKLSLAKGDTESAASHLRTALAECGRVEYPESLRAPYELMLAVALLAQQNYDEAMERLANVQRWVVDRESPAGIAGALLEAYIAIHTETRNTATNKLKLALGLVRRTQQTNLFSYRQIAIPIITFAIESGIEVESASRIAATYELISPEPHWDYWPWPVRVKCLGIFEVTAHGSVLATGGKSLKPFELFKAILAHSAREAPIEDLIRSLWRGDERIGSRKLFDNTLDRLRKALHDDSAFTVRRGYVSINPQRVWVDAWALEAILDQCRHPAQTDLEAVNQVAEKVFSLYQGHFLSNPQQPLRQVVPAERLWSKVQRFILQVGELYQSSGEYERAIAAYLFGIRHDPLVPQFYDGLIPVLTRANRHQEAYHMKLEYTRTCRTLLGEETTAKDILTPRDPPFWRP